ncbi:MAG: hypothetical protein ABSH41_03695 [Syntrophobacteraceae bacterium]
MDCPICRDTGWVESPGWKEWVATGGAARGYFIRHPARLLRCGCSGYGWLINSKVLCRPTSVVAFFFM